MKKFPIFFLPTPWTKPWEKNIASFFNRCFHTPGKIVFFLVRPQTLFLGMFCLKRKDEEISILFIFFAFFFQAALLAIDKTRQDNTLFGVITHIAHYSETIINVNLKN